MSKQYRINQVVEVQYERKHEGHIYYVFRNADGKLWELPDYLFEALFTEVKEND